MRLLALIGSFLLVSGVQAQSLAEHAAAASGATIGTAAGKPISNAITKIFGQTGASTQKAASTEVKVAPKPLVEPARVAQPAAQGESGPMASPDEPAPSRHGGFAAHPRSSHYAAAITPPAAVTYVAEPPVVKEPTAEEMASIQVGASEKEVFTTLGQPESKVTIPDDGHLVEICQYWSKGKQLGTVRLDNGQVVNVESRSN